MTGMSEAPAEGSLYPDPLRPGRIADEIVRALADGRADRWSDMDMLVACDGAPDAPWSAALSIREAKRVSFYRTFSTAPQPSGRYWFADESVFHRLDVTFHTIDEMEGIRRTPSLLGHAMTLRDVPLPVPGCIKPPRDAAPAPLLFAEREKEIGGRIVVMGNSVRATLRGERPATPLEAATDALAASLDGVSRRAVMAGGAIGAVAHQFLDMARFLRMKPRA